MPRILALWTKLHDKPLGSWLFGKLVCWKAPYFATIKPRFEELKPGYARVSMKKRHAVHNHIGTVHAIAMCNLAELGAGTMMEASLPQHALAAARYAGAVSEKGRNRSGRRMPCCRYCRRPGARRDRQLRDQ